MDDYAVVVGVARYPELSAEGAAADLEGPDNDAQDVYDWLVSPDGGGLDPGNVKLLRSARLRRRPNRAAPSRQRRRSSWR